MNPADNYRSESSYLTAIERYEQALECWPVPAERRTVPTALGETFVLSWGNPVSRPLVLLHGSAANSATLAADAARYGERFRVHAIDLPGETGKSTPLRPPYEGDAYPSWLVEVLDGLGITKAAVAGLSLGGWVALRFAAAHPGRVERLVLLAPGGVAPARKRFLAMSLLYRPLGRWGVQRITHLVFAPQPAPPGVAEGFAFMLRHYRARRDNLPVIPDDELRRVTAPALLLAGAQDQLLDMPATARRLAALLPGVAVEVDRDAGHVLFGRAPRALEFLLADPVPVSV